jgi:hypothetical protein
MGQGNSQSGFRSRIESAPPSPQADAEPAEIPDDGFKELMRRCVKEAVDIVK